MPDRLRRPTFELVPRYFRVRDREFRVLENFCQAFDRELRVWEQTFDILEDFWRVGRMDSVYLRYAAYRLGFPSTDLIAEENFRGFLEKLPGFYRRKGDLRMIEEVLLEALGLTSTIEPLWTDPSHWVVGVSTVGGEDYVGPPYRRQDPLAFTVGAAVVGESNVGDDRIDPGVPRRFTVQLTSEPPSTTLDAVRFLVDFFKGAEENYRIVWPGITPLWVLDSSRLGIDTQLAASCWEVGTSKVGISTVVCGPEPAAPTPLVLAS